MNTYEQGFTLIELSIVLVIIGLIVGGVLVGQDLIRSAETRATITQIEKYNTAVNTFRTKFNAIPGDITAAGAATFGLTTRVGLAGQGDGNGLLDGEAGLNSYLQGGGETGMFWVDLSSAAGGNLVEGSFTLATPTSAPTVVATSIPSYMPAAKISGGRFVYVYEYNGQNWYGISGVTAITAGALSSTNSTATIPIIQAYNMDKKMDDGFPTTGTVQAMYINAAGTVGTTVAPQTSPNTAPSATAALTDCYSTDTPPVYDTNKNNGTGANCGLSFRFQ